MNEEYRRQLLAEEKRLLKGLGRASEGTHEESDPDARDWSDESVVDEEEGEQFKEAEMDSATLKLVRDALKRIDDGTFGKCLVDGRPIEEKRLKAMPWTPYCLKHEKQLERSSPPQTPTL